MKKEKGIAFIFLIFGLLSVGSFMVFVSCSKTDFSNKEQLTDIKTEQRINTVKQIRIVGQWLNEGRRETLVRDFCREYEFKNQNILVDLKFPEEFLDNHADRTSNVRFVSGLISKEDPDWDIIRLNNQIQAIGTEVKDPQWAKKHLVDFSQFPEFNAGTMPKLLSRQVKEEWGGIIPGPFLEGSYWALWTNKNVTDKLGISIKHKGMSIDDFISYLKVVNEYNKANPGDYIIPIHEAGDWKTAFAFVFHLYASALNNNNELFNTDVTQNKLNAWYKTLQALEEISNLNPFADQWQNVKWAESNKDLLNERCLFYVNGSWMYNIWEDADVDKTLNIFPSELPVFNPVDLYPSAYFVTWGVLKSSPNRNEAVKLLLAMNKPEMADMWVRYTKCPTGIKGRMTDLAFGTDQFEGFTNYIQSMYSENIYNFSEELAKYINGVTDANQTNYREVLLGNLTAEQAFQLMQQKLL